MKGEFDSAGRSEQEQMLQGGGTGSEERPQEEGGSLAGREWLGEGRRERGQGEEGKEGRGGEGRREMRLAVGVGPKLLSPECGSRQRSGKWALDSSPQGSFPS